MVLNDTRFYIPTRGRVDRQLTLAALPTEIVQRCVTLVCPIDEVDALRANYPGVDVLAQPDHIKTIGQKRAWIFWQHLSDEWAWQFDDDLIIKTRAEGGKNYRVARERREETLNFFNHTLPEYQSRYPVLGLGTSYFAPMVSVRDNYHLGFAWGMNKHARSILRMDRMDVFEDIDFTLQMLKAGQRIGLLYDVVVDQKQADAPGGVTGERNVDTIERDFNRLISFHKDCVERKPLREGAHPAAVTKVAWRRAAKIGGLV